MKRIFCTITFAGLALAGNGPGGPGAGQGRPDMSKLAVIAGEVTKVLIAPGAQHPSIVVDGKTIQLAPIHYLVENGFEVAEGNRVEVKAAPCADPAKPYLFAVEVLNLTTGDKIELRAADGTPLWVRGGPGWGRGARAGAGGGCISQASIATVTGTVSQVTMGLGVQMPTLVLQAGGQLLSLKIGPERILLDAGFEIARGDTLTVRYGRCTARDELVALTITNAAGVTVKLRNDDGSVAW